MTSTVLWNVILCLFVAWTTTAAAETSDSEATGDDDGGVVVGDNGVAGDGELLPELIVKVIKKPRNCTRRARAGDRLRVHYVGRIGDSKKGEVFDSSLEREVPYEFTLGSGQAIRAYEEGVPGMCKGERRVLIVPPHLGYGDEGVRGVIPPGATIRFWVELVSIRDGGGEKKREEETGANEKREEL